MPRGSPDSYQVAAHGNGNTADTLFAPEQMGLRAWSDMHSVELYLLACKYERGNVLRSSGFYKPRVATIHSVPSPSFPRAILYKI